LNPLIFSIFPMSWLSFKSTLLIGILIDNCLIIWIKTSPIIYDWCSVFFNYTVIKYQFLKKYQSNIKFFICFFFQSIIINNDFRTEKKLEFIKLIFTFDSNWYTLKSMQWKLIEHYVEVRSLKSIPLIK